MSQALHSSHWYRIAGLRLALRAQVAVTRHVYRGEPWYVIQDPLSGRNWRFSAAAERIIRLMDGVRTVDDIWAAAGRGADAPTQDEILALLSQLHAADALSIDVAPDLAELLQRGRQRQSREWLGRFSNPLAMRTRLFDPDRFLNRTVRHVRPLFSRWAALLWLAVVLWATVLCGMHWEALGHSFQDLMNAPSSMVLALLIYPLIKAVHELGHAYAVKVHGGEVHEIGLMWLLLMPVPYVDASASAAFPGRGARITVSSAGIIAETFIAALAMMLWTNIEPGMVRAAAYNVMLIAGLSTVLFNGNPLLRYDGYYVLADLLEIPNLAARANAHAGYLLRRWLLGQRDAQSVTDAVAERRWLTVYAFASFVYRQFVLLAIMLVVAAWSKALAILVGVWSVGVQLLYPAVRALRRLAGDARLQADRGWYLLRGALAASVVVGLCVMPVRLTTRAEGVLWTPENGEVRAGTDGVLQDWLTAPGVTVHAGQPLAELDDPTLDARLAAAAADYRAAEARHLAARATDAVDAGTRLAELQHAETVYQAALESVDERTLRSPADGRFVVARPDDATGHFYRQGDIVGYVVTAAHGTVLAVVSQDDIGLLKSGVAGVQVRLSSDPAEVHRAQIARLTPAGDFKLPSAVLGRPAGGTVAVAADDPKGLHTLSRVFRVELTLDGPIDRLGGRAYVSFDHGREALALRGWRALRQLFLRRFDA